MTYPVKPDLLDHYAEMEYLVGAIETGAINPVRMPRGGSDNQFLPIGPGWKADLAYDAKPSYRQFSGHIKLNGAVQWDGGPSDQAVSLFSAPWEDYEFRIVSSNGTAVVVRASPDGWLHIPTGYYGSLRLSHCWWPQAMEGG